MNWIKLRAHGRLLAEVEALDVVRSACVEYSEPDVPHVAMGSQVVLQNSQAR